jgi:hypothetical protein
MSLRDVEVPTWWREESRRLVSTCPDRRAVFRALFGLSDSTAGSVDPEATVPLPLSELEPFLVEKAAAQEPGGERQPLRYLVSGKPPRQSEGPSEVMISMKAGGDMFAVGAVDVRMDDAASPLAWLQRFSESIGHMLAVDPAEVTAWILCDREITLPWVDIEAHLRVDAVDSDTVSADNILMKLVVGTPRVPAATVVGVYTRMQRGLLGHRPTRQPSRWPYLVAAFMSEWLKEHSRPRWTEAFGEFKRRYSDAPYASMRTFRDAYYQFSSKERGEES